MDASHEPSTSLTLLGAMQDNAERDEAWRKFLERYKPFLQRRLARHGVQNALAEDLMQVVCVKLLHHLSSYDPAKGKFRAWLSSILKHAMLDEIRRQGRRPGDEAQGGSVFLDKLEKVAEMESDSLAEDMELLLREQDRVVEEVQKRVEPKSWQAYYRMRIDNQGSAAKIGAELGMSVGAVHQAAHRVAALLREEGERRLKPPEERT
jgi:RNA polymerase sigma factor (sigma-70 family)